MQFVEEKINKEVYLKLLQEHFPGKPDRIFGKEKWRFQQDNAPAHTSRLVKEWIGENIPRKIDHPP